MKTLEAEYFETMYAKDRDPWRFASSPYEAEKYRDTINALEARTYRHMLEVGCSIGVLTELLACRSDYLTAIDISAIALAEAQKRCRYIPQVHFEMSALPQQAPMGCFDLVVLSEVCYYWSADDLHAAKEALLAVSDVEAGFLLVHWTPFVESYPQTGDAVHEAFLQDDRFVHMHGHRAEQYRLDYLMLRPT